MKYKVEKGIPIPPSNTGRNRNPLSFVGQLRDLKKSESIFVPEKSTINISTVATRASRDTGHKYTARTMDGGVRIWRVS